MLALVVVLAAAAAAAPNQPPFKGRPNPSAFLDGAYQAEALARFHGSIGGQEELGKIQSALGAFTDRLEPLPEQATAGNSMIHPSSFINDTRHKRGAPVNHIGMWNKTQPIAIGFLNSIASYVGISIYKTIWNISDNTCLTFDEKGSGPVLTFHGSHGCSSSLGRTLDNGFQMISIGPGCISSGIIAQQIMYSLGINFSQKRKDRDAYVTVNIDDVYAGQVALFNKLPDNYNNNFGVPYEYGSVMHFSAKQSSKTGKDVLIAKETGYQKTMGQRNYVTFNDYKLINLFYKCNETCTNSITCHNGGYQSYKNCNTCICPDFYTGTNCQTPKNAIAVTESAPFKTAYKQAGSNTTIFTSASPIFNWDYYGKDSIKLITAPAGRKIRVTINEYYDFCNWEKCNDTCQLFGLELVDTANADLTSVGKLFCSTKDKGLSFVSKSNVIGYKAYAAPGLPFESQITFTVV